MMRILNIFLSLFLFLSLSNAEDSRALKVKFDKMKKEQRVALIIGNDNYKSFSKLKNPVNDAKSMKRILESKGFKVHYTTNASKKEIRKKIKSFTYDLKSGGVGFFYYAGHGIAVDGKNYIIPIGSDISEEADVEYEAVSVDYLTKKMSNARNRLNIVVLDACRNNPFNRSAGGGLAPLTNARGMFVAYATEAGNVASDGTGENGVFTKHLIDNIKKAIPIEKVFKETRAAVVKETNGKQFPGVYNQIMGDFYFTIPQGYDKPINININSASMAQPAVEKQTQFSFSDVKPSKYSLTIKTTPPYSTVKILNIQQKYYDGIMLPSGNYKIEVTKYGYYPKKGNINLQSNLNLNVTLTKDSSIKATTSSSSTSRGDVYYDKANDLMWQNNDSTKYYKWQEAYNYCENLNLNGYSDWRMPTLSELKTLKRTSAVTNSKGHKHYMPKEMADGFKKYSWLWSKTDYEKLSDPNEVYIFSFHRGRSFYFHKVKNSVYIRCVRGNAGKKSSYSTSKVYDTTSSVYKDEKTGYLWQNNSSTKYYKWQEAVDYCNNLTLNGRSDWHLPSIDELKTILYSSPVTNSKGHKHYMPKQMADGFGKYSWLWSSSDAPKYGTNEKYIIRYHAGRTLWDNAIKGSRYVRCISKGNGGYSSSNNSSTTRGDVYKDSSSGLLWQNNDSTKYYKWQDAYNYCENLNLNGRTDWRMPTLSELETLKRTSAVTNSKGHKHYMPKEMADGFKKYSWLWSTTDYEKLADPNEVYIFSFHRGRSFYFHKVKNSVYIRCVAGGASKSTTSYTSNGSKTYKDSSSGLLWQNELYTDDEKKAYDYKRPSFQKVGTWENAKKYCQNLYLDGYDDWRLPTKSELLSLVVSSKQRSSNGYSYYIKSPFLDKMPKPNGKRTFAWFWASTEHNIQRAADVYFYYDGKSYNEKKTSPGYIRCVR